MTWNRFGFLQNCQNRPDNLGCVGKGSGINKRPRRIVCVCARPFAPKFEIRFVFFVIGRTTANLSNGLNNYEFIFQTFYTNKCTRMNFRSWSSSLAVNKRFLQLHTAVLHSYLHTGDGAAALNQLSWSDWCLLIAAFIDQEECFFGLRSNEMHSKCVHDLVEKMNAAQQKVLAANGNVDFLFNKYCR